MSSFILCQTKLADTPYFIENISMNIYSIEELCYYLCENLYLIDETLMNEGLYQWIQQELKLPGLAGKLRSVHGKASGLEDYVYPVLKEIGYLSYEEAKALGVRIQVLNKEPELMRAKRKGDALVENGMYAAAVQIYRDILQKDMKGLRKGFEGTVWYNLGCTYSYLFQKQKAMDCFEKAYWLLRTGSTLKSYLLVCLDTLSPKEYEKRLKEMGIDERTSREIRETKKEFDRQFQAPVNDREMGEVLQDLTREYHRNTGV